MIMGIPSSEGSRDHCSGLGFKTRRVSRDSFKDEPSKSPKDTRMYPETKSPTQNVQTQRFWHQELLELLFMEVQEVPPNNISDLGNHILLLLAVPFSLSSSLCRNHPRDCMPRTGESLQVI
uniref:Uncharacterized protein n=1 Tax=Mus musculus TaxID=10090 RepID=Q9D4P3_MOUSE|nr:unnamed protein product [Mus musculus]